jgi:hypothetical protein
MYISNRFDLGDEAYFIDEDNKPVKAKVETIIMQVTNNAPFPSPHIVYILALPGEGKAPFEEEDLYRSEWELRDAWMKNLITFV